MKIVFIGGRDITQLGGIESYMYNLTRELVHMGHECVVYCESNQNSVVSLDGVKVFYQKGFKSNLICKPWLGLKATLRTLFCEQNVSVIHYNAWPPSLWSFIPRLFGVASLMQGHGLEWQRSKYSRMQQDIMRFMERVTAYLNKNLVMCSDDQTRYFKETYGRDAVTIPTAVNLPDENPVGKSKVLENYELEQGKYFLFMGRLVQDKNPDYLIKAFMGSQLPEGMKLVIAGDNAANPGYVDRLKAIAADDSRVIFVGAVYDVDKDALFRNAYAYCIPSTIEGLSISLLEAMSYKLPIIASDIPANRELLGDRAVWAGVENITELEDALESSVDRKTELAEFAEENYQNVINNYTWKIVAEKYISYLESIVRQ